MISESCSSKIFILSHLIIREIHVKVGKFIGINKLFKRIHIPFNWFLFFENNSQISPGFWGQGEVCASIKPLLHGRGMGWKDSCLFMVC